MRRELLLAFTLGLLASGIPLGILSYYLAGKYDRLRNYGFQVSRSPISVNLSISSFTEPSRLGSEAELKTSIISIWDAPNTTINVVLPDGIALVNGDLTWNANLKANVLINLNATIRAIKIGNWTVLAIAKWYFTYDSWYGDVAKLCICVYEDRIVVDSEECPPSTDIPSGYDETRTVPP